MIGSPIYDAIHKDTADTILTLSGLSRSAIDDASTELQTDYEMFCADYSGPDLADGYLGFIAMLQHWRTPWPGNEDSSLNGLTLAQFYLVWAWSTNDLAKYCLGGQAVAQKLGLRSGNRLWHGSSGECSKADIAREAANGNR